MAFKYCSQYDSFLIRGKDDPSFNRPWNLLNEIIKYSSKDKILLDVGCGTAQKIIPLVPYFKKIIAIDISEDMLNAARKNIMHLRNIELFRSSSEKLPFHDGTFDVITCILSRWNVAE